MSLLIWMLCLSRGARIRPLHSFRAAGVLWMHGIGVWDLGFNVYIYFVSFFSIVCLLFGGGAYLIDYHEHFWFLSLNSLACFEAIPDVYEMFRVMEEPGLFKLS
jgi:hypothetical protein